MILGFFRFFVFPAENRLTGQVTQFIPIESKRAKKMGIISIAIRSGICVYAVKYTVDQGAWGDAEKAITFKNNTCKAVNGNEYVKTGKAHFQTYVPMPEVGIMFTMTAVITRFHHFRFHSFRTLQK